MPLITWSETKFYDPKVDADSITYSGFSGHGTYWLRQPLCPPGKSRRKQKEEALDWIEAAINQGHPPGEVTDESIKPPPREQA